VTAEFRGRRGQAYVQNLRMSAKLNPDVSVHQHFTLDVQTPSRTFCNTRMCGGRRRVALLPTFFIPLRTPGSHAFCSCFRRAMMSSLRVAEGCAIAGYCLSTADEIVTCTCFSVLTRECVSSVGGACSNSMGQCLPRRVPHRYSSRVCTRQTQSLSEPEH